MSTIESKKGFATLSKENAAVITALMVWAYRNDVDVTLFKRKGYDRGTWPVLHFRKDDRSHECSFDSMRDILFQAQSCWIELASKLVVEPFDFEEIWRALKDKK